MGTNSITKPHIESDIAVYTLKGVIDERTLQSFFSNLAQHRVILKSLKEISKIGAEQLKKLYKRLES